MGSADAAEATGETRETRETREPARHRHINARDGRGGAERSGGEVEANGREAGS